jgi:hypothetical protein
VLCEDAAGGIKRSISTKTVAAMLKTVDERNVHALASLKMCFDFVLLHSPGEVIGVHPALARRI